MKLTDRSAAAALKAAERPDVRALRSALSRVERNFDEIIGLQNEEIYRLRRMILAAAKAFRSLQSKTGMVTPTRLNAFVVAMEPFCLEADAISFADDVPPKVRPVPKRG